MTSKARDTYDKKEQIQLVDTIPVIAETKGIKSLIYFVRVQQVMRGSALAMLYQE